MSSWFSCFSFFFFFNDTATTEIYTLSLHDALPISIDVFFNNAGVLGALKPLVDYPEETFDRDRKRTRLNSSHSSISYAVFCLKKKKQEQQRVTEHTG